MARTTVGVVRVGNPSFGVLWKSLDFLKELGRGEDNKIRLVLPAEMKVPKKVKAQKAIQFSPISLSKRFSRSERDRKIVLTSEKVIFLWDGWYGDSVRLVDLAKKKGKSFITVFAPNGKGTVWSKKNVYDAVVWFATLTIKKNHGVFIESQKTPLNKGSLPLLQLMFPKIEENLANHLSVKRFSPFYAGRFRGKSVFVVPVNDVLSVQNGFELDQFVLNSAFEELKEMLKSMNVKQVLGIISVANTVDIVELQHLLSLKAEGVKDFKMKIIKNFSPETVYGNGNRKKNVEVEVVIKKNTTEEGDCPYFELEP